jgi:proteasome lid subunit RPN8/RPN11
MGKRGKVAQVVPLPNTHPRPQVAYSAEPIALLRAIRSYEEQGFDLLAIYHSHPKGSAGPSPADRQQAYWRVPYVIFALESGEVRAYKLPEGEEVVILVDDPPYPPS